jgi:hypothetical protein
MEQAIAAGETTLLWRDPLQPRKALLSKTEQILTIFN